LLANCVVSISRLFLQLLQPFDNGSANDARNQSLLRRIKHFLAVSSKSLGENAEKKNLSFLTIPHPFEK